MGSVQAKESWKVRASVSFSVCAPCFLPSQTYILLHIKSFIHVYYAFWWNLAPCCHLQIIPQASQLNFPPKFVGSFLLKPTRSPWCFLYMHGSRTICFSKAKTTVPRGTHPGRKQTPSLPAAINGWQLFSWGWSCPGSSPMYAGIFVWLDLECVWLLHSKSLFVNSPAMSGK